jgi:hypothetical protein
MNRYQVVYLQPKKKGFAQQSATFYSINDAEFWTKHIETKGAKDIQILVK